MSYVVGFLGDDGTLGRTFKADNMYDALKALEELRDAVGDNFDFFNLKEGEDIQTRLQTYFEDHCVLTTKSGRYFIGGLESL